MPHTQSAKKRMRVSAERRTRNRNVAKGLKLQHKAFEAAIKTNDAGKLKENTSTSMKLIHLPRMKPRLPTRNTMFSADSSAE